MFGHFYKVTGQKMVDHTNTNTVIDIFQGPNHTHSADGHDKLMDFAKDTFPLAVYGLQDVFSGRILFLKLWPSNSDPKLIGKWYLQHLYDCKGTIIMILTVFMCYVFLISI